MQTLAGAVGWTNLSIFAFAAHNVYEFADTL